MQYLVPRRRGWTRLLRTAAFAFCLATCLRILLSGTVIESYIAPSRARSVNKEVNPGQGQPVNDLRVNVGQKSADAIEAPSGGNARVKNEVRLPKRKSDDDAEKDEPKENPEEKKQNENILEDEGGNEDVEECPYKDSKLERFKCFLPAEMTEKGGPFDMYLGQRADKDKVIFLISVDSGYVEMGLNLYETSFKRLGMTNFLYVCSDAASAHELDNHGIDCYIYEQNIKNDKASKYMSRDFIQKTHTKTKIILAALYLGYNVFITDADIVYLKNPQSHLTCPTCDIEIQSDHVELNSGFYLARPTEGAILLHQKMMDKANQSNKTSNQKALNNAVKKLTKDKLIKYSMMDKYRFPCGIYYFERFHRMWAGDNDCKDCVIVHNNWIMGKQAKVYRFKEHLMWVVDTNGYYSDKNRKYLVYENPTDWGDGARTIEVAALKMALQMGHVLNRTVILPAFTCRGCKAGACKTETKKCSLNSHLRVANFDGRFSGLYREHTFLSHPKVPTSVKKSLSPLLVVGSVNSVPTKTASAKNKLEKFKSYIPADLTNGATSSEILKWFGKKSDMEKYSVLRFTSLYHAFQPLDESNPNYRDIMEKIKNGFKKAGYRQY